MLLPFPGIIIYLHFSVAVPQMLCGLQCEDGDGGQEEHGWEAENEARANKTVLGSRITEASARKWVIQC